MGFKSTVNTIIVCSLATIPTDSHPVLFLLKILTVKHKPYMLIKVLSVKCLIPFLRYFPQQSRHFSP